MLAIIVMFVIVLVAWATYERVKWNAQMVRLHYEWIALAEDAERAAVEAEDAAPTLAYGTPETTRAHVALLSIANMYWNAAAQYRVNAAKYIKYLPREDQALARADNTWSGVHSNAKAHTKEFQRGQEIH